MPFLHCDFISCLDDVLGMALVREPVPDAARDHLIPGWLFDASRLIILRMSVSLQIKVCSRVRRSLAAGILLFFLLVSCPRKGRGEEFLDAKVMYYTEASDRIRVLSPTFLYQNDNFAGLSIRIDGIYNSISGASPTGAPPVKRTRTITVPISPAPGTPTPTVPSSPTIRPQGGGDGEDDGEYDDGKIHAVFRKYLHLSGATPAPQPSPAPTPAPVSSPSPQVQSPAYATQVVDDGYSLPIAEVSDERYGLNLAVSKRLGRHMPGVSGSFSHESDYQSLGVALSDSIDFNARNTTLFVGASMTHDQLDPSNGQPSASKNSAEVIVGLAQVVSKFTLLQVNYTFGSVHGSLTDPYKVVELDGVLVPERRPDLKQKHIGYVALTQFVRPLDGSVELSYRRYMDSFDVDSDTFLLGWYQRINSQFTVRLMGRYSAQSAAEFFGSQFSGTPEFYSSDYRVSAFEAYGGGAKLIWTPTDRLSFDVAYERYAQRGKTDQLVEEAYPRANVVTIGGRVWF